MFPRKAQMKPERAELERLRRQNGKLNVARSIEKSGSVLRQEVDVKFGFITKHRGV
jgi:hypothetical protein